jgi:hypothetical protein
VLPRVNLQVPPNEEMLDVLQKYHIPNGTTEQADRPRSDSDGWVTVESMKKPKRKISHGNKPKKKERSHMTRTNLSTIERMSVERD